MRKKILIQNCFISMIIIPCGIMASDLNCTIRWVLFGICNHWQLSSRLGGVNTRQSTHSKGSGKAYGRAWQHGPRAVGES